MPTGYTAEIKNGITFNQYAMSCSRAFGALIMMRDEPADAPIPDEFKPSDYHVKALAEAEEKLRAFQLLSKEECNLEMEKERKELINHARRQIADSNDLHQKYIAMLAQVKEYIPPSTEHEEFKKFMISQIEESIKFDCVESYYANELKGFPTSVGEYKKQTINKLMRDIAYHTKENAEEIMRTNSCNLWVKQLKESLK
ncbi:MAG: hypothetical protein WC373_14505 [Smithella sp.]|jgi:hypothetical protein